VDRGSRGTSALFPLFILWFGLGETSKVMTIMIGVVFLVLINTVTGVKAIDPVLLKAARDLGANQRQIFMKVVIPGALPNIFTGLRLGAGMALILVFITEIEATKAGLGFLLWESYQLLLVKQVLLSPKLNHCIFPLNLFGSPAGGGSILLSLRLPDHAAPKARSAA
jgi:NitT/TauT family transport system permease protein